MSESTNQIIQLISDLSEDELRVLGNFLRQRVPLHPLEMQWGTTAEAILTAIARSTDLTQRGIRGILAEATFEKVVLPPLQGQGWKTATILGDRAFDFLLERGESRVAVQVKLQRREKGVPKEYASKARKALDCPDGKIHVVEVQKTRSGVRNGKKTRPYHFGDFDVLAVNLSPSTGHWDQFMFTVAKWLLPRKADAELIEIMQPVPCRPDEYWTDDLSQCVEWFLSGTPKRLYS